MKRKWYILALIMVFLLLNGCSLRILDDLYQVPKRSDDFDNLQSAIDKNMDGMTYCAPLNGDHLQAVQTADLDGDGVPEYLLFARSTEEKSLCTLVFTIQNGEYVLSDTIRSYGTAFDLVEYAQLDDRPGLELIIGCQISQDLDRSVRVYSLRDGEAVCLMSSNYTRFLTCDLVGDDHRELLVLRPGESEEDNSLAELYRFAEGALYEPEQISLSGYVDRLKRVEVGQLQSGENAVYIDVSVDGSSVKTDVLSVVNGQLTNLADSQQ